ncbi:MAG: class I SAM-dependent methyltransferase [Coxiella-like endosymbiont]
MLPNNLPALDSLAKAHSERLRQYVAQEIINNGPLTFARYMQLALYAPGLGYYSAGAQKFGKAGDFITAPEISPLFSKAVAKQCQQILTDLDGGEILEFGAGSGVMAVDILRELEHHQCLPARYYILEVSADFRERQVALIKSEIPQLLDRVNWLSQLPSHPIRGVIVGNEVIDAMPVHKFKIKNGIKEIYVDYKADQFIWKIDEPSSSLVEAVRDLGIDFTEDYESEINLLMKGWVSLLTEILHTGLILLIDYGFPRHEYYHPDRNQGTIVCHYRHRSHFDPLILIGIQDITAHVDFTVLAEAALPCLMVAGFTHQAAFLLNCGITSFMPSCEDPMLRYVVTQQIKKLTLPSEMGELFKAIALTKNYQQPLLGFTHMNQTERLTYLI